MQDQITLQRHLASKPDWGNFEANARFLQKTGLLGRSLQMLEIGSGKGGLVNHLLHSGQHIVGIDTDYSAIAEARRLHADLPVFVASGDALPFSDEHFDVILSFDLFEHIPDSNVHLREVRRVLKPGGYYLLQTPNKWTNVIFEPIRFSRKFGIFHAFKFLEDHCSLHSYWQLARRFSKNGFDVKFYDIPVVNRFFRDKVQRFLGGFGLIVLKIVNPDKLPLPLRTNFYVQARKL